MAMIVMAAMMSATVWECVLSPWWCLDSRKSMLI
jgi:hypothetical protein